MLENRSRVKNNKTKILTTCSICEASFIAVVVSNNKSINPKVKYNVEKIRYESLFFCSISLLNSNKQINPKMNKSTMNDHLFCAAKTSKAANVVPEIALMINFFKALL